MATTANYDAQADAFSKRPQWLVELDLPRCDNEYTSAPCTAVDAGDGKRCYYTFPTCQDAANFTKVTKTYRFCLADVVWKDPATAVRPYLVKPISIPQKIDPAKIFGYPGQVRIQMLRDFNPQPIDNDKTLFNTGTAGEFWAVLFARTRNYSGAVVRVKRGFAPTDADFVLADFSQVGPDYELRKIEYGKDIVTLTVESPLSKLNTVKIPFTISEDNTVQSTINDSVLSVVINDAAEVPNPADYTRNTVWIEFANGEICTVTARDTGTDTLTIVRGELGTTPQTQTAGTTFEHIVVLGAQPDPDNDPVPRNVVDVLLDLLEWAGVAAGKITTASFARVKGMAWPRSNVLAVLRKPQRVSRLMQPIRETRGILVYIGSSGNFEADVVAPNFTDVDELTDDHLLLDSVVVTEDDENRITRVELWYDPADPDDAGDEPKDYRKGVKEIDAELESANYFNGERAKLITDPWLDPNASVADVRLIARRMITRQRNGIREFAFELELKETDIDVGDQRLITTRKVLDRDGNPETRTIMIVERKPEYGTTKYVGADVNYSGPFLRIGPDTMAQDYDDATAADRAYGYWGDANNRVGDVLSLGYIIW